MAKNSKKPGRPVGRVSAEKQPKKRKYKSKAKLTPAQRSEQNRINGLKGQLKPNDPETGFKDPRIKRTGSPKDRAELSSLAMELLHEVPLVNGEPLKAPDGSEMTAIEAILRRKIQSAEHDDQVIDLAYGKAPKELKVTGGITLTPKRKIGIDADKI